MWSQMHRPPPRSPQAHKGFAWRSCYKYHGHTGCAPKGGGGGRQRSGAFTKRRNGIRKKLPTCVWNSSSGQNQRLDSLH